MKTILFFSILLCAIAMPAIGELTDADLDKIRLLVNEELKPIKADVEILKTEVAYVRGKLDILDTYVIALIALIVIAVGAPQIVIKFYGLETPYFSGGRKIRPCALDHSVFLKKNT